MPTSIVEVRPLTEAERHLLCWLLAHSTKRALSFLPQVLAAHVVSRCGCGCASIDLSVSGRTAPQQQNTEVLADYRWDAPEGQQFGIFAFARGDILAGLEVWSIDGQATPSALPQVAQLRPIDS
jgi:hypothetical protein